MRPAAEDLWDPEPADGRAVVKETPRLPIPRVLLFLTPGPQQNVASATSPSEAHVGLTHPLPRLTCDQTHHGMNCRLSSPKHPSVGLLTHVRGAHSLSRQAQTDLRDQPWRQQPQRRPQRLNLQAALAALFVLRAAAPCR